MLYTQQQQQQQFEFNKNSLHRCVVNSALILQDIFLLLFDWPRVIHFKKRTFSLDGSNDIRNYAWCLVVLSGLHAQTKKNTTKKFFQRVFTPLYRYSSHSFSAREDYQQQSLGFSLNGHNGIFTKTRDHTIKPMTMRLRERKRSGCRTGLNSENICTSSCWAE